MNYFLSDIHGTDDSRCISYPLQYSCATLAYIIHNSGVFKANIKIVGDIGNETILQGTIDVSTTVGDRIYHVAGSIGQKQIPAVSIFSSDKFRQNLIIIFENITFRNTTLSFNNIRVSFHACIFNCCGLSDQVRTVYLPKRSQLDISMIRVKHEFLSYFHSFYIYSFTLSEH